MSSTHQIRPENLAQVEDSIEITTPTGTAWILIEDLAEWMVAQHPEWLLAELVGRDADQVATAAWEAGGTPQVD